jgi:hypothetical protein
MVKLSPLYLEQIDIATQKGENLGRVAEGQLLILRQLTRKFGDLNPEMIESINQLTLEQLECKDSGLGLTEPENGLMC